MSERLVSLLSAHKAGEALGIPSVCSAHPFVLQTAMRRAGRDGSLLLVESTCNQVNQYGGYTGMTPPDFSAFVHDLARANGLPAGQLLLGGDHLGPSAWQAEPADRALAKAGDLVQACVRAGYVKIHLDASMHLGDDDPSQPLPVELVARRAAEMARLAEAAADPRLLPRYVIGTEVPVPGGALEHETGVQVTTLAGVSETLEAHRAAFERSGLQAAWERVMAVVVQPGVEFGDDFVHEYHPQAAKALSRFVESTIYVFEAHSTDYQSRQALQNMVRDHFAILKVGPGLTHAYRAGVLSLVAIEAEIIPLERRARLLEVIEERMLANPEHWQKHYRGTRAEKAHKRMHSRSDRLRYYWSDPDVHAALARLLRNLSSGPLPEELVQRFAPEAAGEALTAPALLERCVGGVLDDYAFACRG